MKCLETRRDGRSCWNRATTTAGGVAVCKWHVVTAWRRFAEVDKRNLGNPLWAPVKDAAIADSGRRIEEE